MGGLSSLETSMERGMKRDFEDFLGKTNVEGKWDLGGFRREVCER